MSDLGSALPGKLGMASASQATGKRSYAEMVKSMPSVLATGVFAQPKAHTPGMVPSGHATVPPQPLASTPQPREGQKIKKQKVKTEGAPAGAAPMFKRPRHLPENLTEAAALQREKMKKKEIKKLQAEVEKLQQKDQRVQDELETVRKQRSEFLHMSQQLVKAWFSYG
jgi:hypothetical protein